jgi:hypothetical protein
MPIKRTTNKSQQAEGEGEPLNRGMVDGFAVAAFIPAEERAPCACAFRSRVEPTSHHDRVRDAVT